MTAAFLDAVLYAWWAVVAYVGVLALVFVLYLVIIWAPDQLRRRQLRRSPWRTALRHGVRRVA